MRSSAVIEPGWLTVAVSVARFTDAATPGRRLSCFSTRATQDAHVIPPTTSSIRELYHTPPRYRLLLRLHLLPDVSATQTWTYRAGFWSQRQAKGVLLLGWAGWG